MFQKTNFPLETYAKLAHIDFMSKATRPERTIIYFNIPSFPTAVAKLMHPEFKNKPIAIAPPNSDQSKIMAADELAKMEGIFKGMPLAVAKRFCRSLKILPPEPDIYKKINFKISEHIARSLQFYEIERQGKMYLDFTGFERMYGPAQDFAQRFQENILNDFKLGSSLGLAKNKLVSKIAAKSISLEQDIYLIPKGREQKFLSPLSHMLLPISRKIEERHRHQMGSIFDDLNIQTIQDLRSLSKPHLLVAFRDHADTIYQMARGIDHRPLIRPLREEMIIEEMHLAEETNSLTIIRSHVHQLLERATFRLREQNKFAQKVYLSIRYSDYKLVETEKKIPNPFRMPFEIEREIHLMLNQLFYRRTNIRFIGFELSGLCQQYRQLSFLDQLEGEVTTTQNQQLTDQIDKIRKKFGFEIIKGKLS